jgi:membrane protein YdbS with pleckstrin-like domain
MATRNNFATNWWHKLQQDSVSWGALILWVVGLVVLLVLVTMFPTT